MLQTIVLTKNADGSRFPKNFGTPKRCCEPFDSHVTSELQSSFIQMDVGRRSVPETFGMPGMFPQTNLPMCHACWKPQSDLRWGWLKPSFA